jgi:cytochrome P450
VCTIPGSGLSTVEPYYSSPSKTLGLGMTSTTTYPIWDLEARGDAHAMWARMRADDPVYEAVGPLTGNHIWLITRYADCEFVIRHPAIGKEPGKAGLPVEAVGGDELLTRSMISVDPPDHTRLRRLVNKAFTPRVVARLEPRIRDLVDGMLDAAAARGHLEVIADLAFPLPVTVIAELLGIPAGDRERFREWSRAVLAPAADATAAQEAGLAFAGYINDLAVRRRADPGEDLLSRLLVAEDEGEQLDHTELLAMVMLLLIAGHETTVNLIGNGVLALLDHPPAWRELADDPSLAPAVVEEVLRYDGPVEVAPLRFAYEDVAVGGSTIPRGGLVAPVLLAANRDPARFDDPDTFDVHRNARHLAFGHGIHFCLGAPLARLEGAIVFEQLARRFPSMTFGCERSELRWLEGLLMRGVTELPVRLAW